MDTVWQKMANACHVSGATSSVPQQSTRLPRRPTDRTPLRKDRLMSGATDVVRTPRKAAIAAWTGSALESYDFPIPGTAAARVSP